MVAKNTKKKATPETKEQTGIAGSKTRRRRASSGEEGEAGPRKESRRSLEAKWGEAVVKAGWTAVPSILLEEQAALELKPIDLAVLIHLIHHWWDADRPPWPRKELIALRLRVDESAVQRSVRRMEGLGLVARSSKTDRDGWTTSNYYDLSGLVSRLQELAAEIDTIRARRRAEDQARRDQQRVANRQRRKAKRASAEVAGDGNG